jgi:hypothetical protein
MVAHQPCEKNVAGKVFLLEVFMANPQFRSSFENASQSGENSQELLSRLPADSEIWHNLKQAIAASSGFERWQLERNTDGRLSGLNLDNLVRYYLRETLETLAY